MPKPTLSKRAKPKARPKPENRLKKVRNPTPPPVEYQFKPGQSGNPGGRPKLLSGAYKAMLAEVNPKDPEGRTNAELIAMFARVEAFKGDIGAMREIRSATEGDKTQARTYKDDIIDLLLEGRITEAQVTDELPDIAPRLVATARLRRNEDGAMEAGGPSEVS